MERNTVKDNGPYWVAAAMILVLTTIGVALWYSSIPTSAPLTCDEKIQRLKESVSSLKEHCAENVDDCAGASEYLYRETQNTLQECGYDQG